MEMTNRSPYLNMFSSLRPRCDDTCECIFLALLMGCEQLGKAGTETEAENGNIYINFLVSVP